MILAGGRGSRLGGREKGDIRISGERLIDLVNRAAREVGCQEVIIAGDITSDGAVTVREEPPFGGPAAGLAAALGEVTGDWVLLLACDLARAGQLGELISSAFDPTTAEGDGMVVVERGRRQWLSGLYRRSSVEKSLAGIERVSGTSLESLLGTLNLVEIDDPDGLSRDIDTPEDLAAIQRKESK